MIIMGHRQVDQAAVFYEFSLERYIPPDHSTLSKNRHWRFRQSDLLWRVFETAPRRCISEGLVGAEDFAVDASLIKAEANRQNGIKGEKGLPPETAGRVVEK